jgi:hypothetical protein
MAQAAATLGAGPRPQSNGTKTSAEVLKTLAASTIIPEADGADGHLQRESMTSFDGVTGVALEVATVPPVLEWRSAVREPCLYKVGKLAFDVVMW